MRNYGFDPSGIKAAEANGNPLNKASAIPPESVDLVLALPRLELTHPHLPLA
jgi:hypothetical protein